MASKRAGGSTNFVTAAKVLFESAKKVGAVQTLGATNRLYAQQLKRIQAQSKRKGGSLGNVSYNVAEFLETHRTSKSSAVHSAVTTQKKVPLICIPQQCTPKQEHSARKSTVSKAVPTLNFVTNDKVSNVVSLDTSKTIAPFVGSGAASVSEKKKTVESNPLLELKVITGEQRTVALSDPKIAEEQNIVKSEEGNAPRLEPNVFRGALEAEIAEDKPLFEVTLAAENRASLVMDREVSSFFETPVTPLKRSSESISAPLSMKLPESKEAGRYEKSVLGSVSVDVWELQRERELEQLRHNQENSENERLMSLRRKEHEELGDKWVKSRTIACDRLLHKDLINEALHLLYFSHSWESCLGCFRQLVNKSSNPSSSVVRQAVALAHRQLRRAPLQYRDHVMPLLLKELQDRKLTDDSLKFELREQAGDAFLKTYRSAPESVKDSLDFFTTSKAMSTLLLCGSWLEAIEVFYRSNERFSDRAGELGLRLLSISRSLEPGVTQVLCENVAKTLTTLERFGKLHHLQLAKMQRGAKRRHALLQIVNSNEVDEEVYGELLRITAKENIGGLLDEIRKRGLNADDPAIRTAICWKAFDVDNPQALYHAIDQQEEVIGIRPAHILAAVAMARLSKKPAILRSTIRLLKKMPSFKCKFILRKILPILHENGMNKEIVELADLYAARVPIAKALPQAVAFVNQALVAEGRAPLSEHTVENLRLNDSKASKRGDAAANLAPVDSKSTSPIVSTSEMLLCAKERDWVRALTLISALQPGSLVNYDAETLTLLYNCALSSSVEKTDIVRLLHKRMVASGICVNATTSNAILGSLMKSSEANEAIEFYEGTGATERDISTYSIMLSLLGKHSMWQMAVKVFQDAQTSQAKCPPVVFALGIGAVHNHSWEVTLNMFKGLLKECSPQNVSDSVIDKVIRCLAHYNRTTELKKVEAELLKSKLKKGKQQPRS
ncbi:hypothetical protein ERJ75_001194800 [Trypanosoma vivax]|nr:hypothetical protein ERJ75_001194800 [Trypanosoma vivax]